MGLNPASGEESGKQNREDAGEKNTVKSAGAANRGKGRIHLTDLLQVEEIGPDKRPKSAGHIGNRRGMVMVDHDGQEGGEQRGYEERQSNADALDRPGEPVTDSRHEEDADKTFDIKACFQKQIA